MGDRRRAETPEQYNPAMHITVVELRALGFNVPDDLPDNGWINRGDVCVTEDAVLRGDMGIRHIDGDTVTRVGNARAYGPRYMSQEEFQQAREDLAEQARMRALYGEEYEGEHSGRMKFP